MQDALAAHSTIPNWLLDRVLDQGEEFWSHGVFTPVLGFDAS